VGGGDIFTLSRILGHESVAVTERHYAYLLTENLRGAMEGVILFVIPFLGFYGYRRASSVME
jgi:hypothetical protein